VIVDLGVDFSANVTDDFIKATVPVILRNLMANNNSLTIDEVVYPAAIEMVFEREVPYMNGTLISADNVTACTYINVHGSVLSLNSHYREMLHTVVILARYMLSQIRPPFRLSVTRVDQSKTVELRIMQFSPYSSPIPLVFAILVSSRNSDGIPRAGASNKVKGGWGKQAIFVVLMLSLGGCTS